jgi:hypothetical protein
LKTAAHLRDRFGVDPILRVLGIAPHLLRLLADLAARDDPLGRE